MREPLADDGAPDVVVLSGGTGGAKLARGMLDVVGPQRLAVIANTGDDLEIYGAHVSPDPDLISFWLADLIDERGWGLRGDSFAVMDALRALGVEVWFNLGDRDLAWCLERRRMQREDGLRPTEALRALNERIGVHAQVLPMCDTPLRTFVDGVPLQEFLIRGGGRGPIEAVDLRAGEPGDGRVSPTPEVVRALAGARVIVVGPSNPVISIRPILVALEQLLPSLDAPVVAVSPIVGGEVLKGPTAAFLSSVGHPASAAGVAAYYQQEWGLLDGMVADEPLTGIRSLRIDTRMDDPDSRARVAEHTLRFAQSLG
ncbi:MAG: 2-phospho-L-lactate transferase CofD family protein [Solirubrobacterales bacterium]|nr:2-phospho-L-lactate transferase CofD family protein [Solirubrobacterales bacterium]